MGNFLSFLTQITQSSPSNLSAQLFLPSKVTGGWEETPPCIFSEFQQKTVQIPLAAPVQFTTPSWLLVLTSSRLMIKVVNSHNFIKWLTLPMAAEWRICWNSAVVIVTAFKAVNKEYTYLTRCYLIVFVCMWALFLRKATKHASLTLSLCAAR